MVVDNGGIGCCQGYMLLPIVVLVVARATWLVALIVLVLVCIVFNVIYNGFISVGVALCQLNSFIIMCAVWF